MKRTQLNFISSATLSLLLLLGGTLSQTQTSAQNKVPSIPETPAGHLEVYAQLRLKLP